MKMKQIGARIRVLREKQGLTQQELADRLQVTRQTVSNYEIGRSQPDLEMLEQLAPADTPITLRLDVRESNTAAQALYTDFGFSVCGRRPRFYGSEDAVEMQLILPRSSENE